ncbi:uncharacterized protein LOC119563452 isoform X2 [Drosophila subpulchrella]|uniref:uncharacterized protein LOC119563452 isoform X2 n=1 Tax=Drosophila subpulchrella TaxID=1486046 RepID=UPI0018A1AE97|nr:uncharacterized protein LOC119563452 isoform X2 [Drosophila subpulchrella]
MKSLYTTGIWGVDVCNIGKRSEDGLLCEENKLQEMTPPVPDSEIPCESEPNHSEFSWRALVIVARASSKNILMALYTAGLLCTRPFCIPYLFNIQKMINGQYDMGEYTMGALCLGQDVLCLSLFIISLCITIEANEDDEDDGSGSSGDSGGDDDDDDSGGS